MRVATITQTNVCATSIARLGPQDDGHQFGGENNITDLRRRWQVKNMRSVSQADRTSAVTLSPFTTGGREQKPAQASMSLRRFSNASERR